MGACVRLAKKVECPRPTDHCRNMTVQVYVHMLGENITRHERGCGTQYECIHGRCDRNFGEKYGEVPGAYNMCNMSCCTGNLCPEGNMTIHGTGGGPAKGARGGSDAFHPVGLSVTASALLSLVIKAYFLWATYELFQPRKCGRSNVANIQMQGHLKNMFRL